MVAGKIDRQGSNASLIVNKGAPNHWTVETYEP
jgi:hypothetical protein